MKEGAGEPKVIEKEKKPATAASGSRNEPSLGKNRNERKTNGQGENTADIRFYFKHEKNFDDNGVT